MRGALRLPAIRRFVVLACLGMLAAACTQQEGGAVIGAPAAPSSTQPSPITFDPTVIQGELNQQIAQYTTVPPGTPGDLPDVSILTAREQDRLWALQDFYYSQLQRRLADLQTLLVEVGNSNLSYWQKASITSSLEVAYSQVNQMLTVIANAEDVSHARTDRAAIYALRVGDVVLPSARKMIKAYTFLNLASFYAGEASGLQPQIANCQSQGFDVTAAQADANGLAVQSQAMRNDAYAILADVGSQTSAGMRAALYPESLGAAASLRAQSDSANAHAAIASMHAQGCV